MPTTEELRRAVADALALVSAQPGVREVEAFAAANRTLLARLNYTSHIPCNGVEEPKSSEAYGLGLQVAFDTADGIAIVRNYPSAAPADYTTTALGNNFAQAGSACKQNVVPDAQGDCPDNPVCH